MAELALRVVLGILLLGATVTVILVLARPKKCTHPNVVWVTSGVLQECPDCYEIVEWSEDER